jgi:hypothetical protein
MLMSEV